MLHRALLGMGLLLLASCSSPSTGSSTVAWRNYEKGKASWYGGRWHGRATASGERFNQWAMTAAHKKLPFGTWVRVTNLSNGRMCIVRVNDRGPFVRGRVIDLSAAAAQQIGLTSSGIAPVRLEVAR